MKLFVLATLLVLSSSIQAMAATLLASVTDLGASGYRYEYFVQRSPTTPDIATGVRLTLPVVALPDVSVVFSNPFWSAQTAVLGQTGYLDFNRDLDREGAARQALSDAQDSAAPLRAQVASVQSDIAAKEAQKDALFDRLDALVADGQVVPAQQISGEIVILDEQLARLAEELTTLSATLAPFDAEIAAQRAKLAQTDLLGASGQNLMRIGAFETFVTPGLAQAVLTLDRPGYVSNELLQIVQAPSLAPVPLPAGFVLLCSAFALLACRARRSSPAKGPATSFGRTLTPPRRCSRSEN